MRYTWLKDAALIVSGVAVAAAFFFTVGSRSIQTDVPCNDTGEFPPNLNDAHDCPSVQQKGFPVWYMQDTREGRFNEFGLTTDIVLWLIAGEVLTSGAFMLIPDKTDKKKK